ncbi:MAG: carboxylating nicotinate-nucleotide diphosphorylase [Gammaproteobacteria bacterium]
MHSIQEQIKTFLEEDVGSGDLTASIIPDTCIARAEVVARESMVLCGRDWFSAVFQALNAGIVIEWRTEEGADVGPGETICTLTGRARDLLTGERTALNLLQTLSSVACEARKYAQAVSGTGCRILDTRKTIPGLRMAQKYAVKCGGGYNHRIGLYDGILIKENHIAAAGSIAEAVKRARQIGGVPVEVEVENLEEFSQALKAAPDRVMLDNFILEDMHRAVALNGGAVEIEASGNVTLDNVREIAETGVDFISVGAITKNIRAVDLSMRIILAQNDG